MANFRKLEVWKKSFELSKLIYKSTAIFPKEEIFALVSQMRRASVSISSNIAKGNSIRTVKDYIKYLNNA